MRRTLRLLPALILVVAALPAAAATVTPVFHLAWGSNGVAPGQFAGIGAVGADPSGNVYVVDAINARIQKFNALGNYLFEWGTPGSGNGQLAAPLGLAVDAAGNVFVADYANHRVQKFSSAGAYITQWGTFGAGNGQFDGPRGIAVDAAGNVYVTDSNNHRVEKFDAAGNFLTQWGSLGSGTGQLNTPKGLTLDRFGYVYVADTYNSRVQKFTAAGVYVASLGANGLGNGEFQAASAVCVDPAGNVYVADEYSNRVQMLSPSGVYLTQWGSTGSGNGQFSTPNAIAIDGAGNLYVGDNGNRRVQKFSGAGASLAHAAPIPLLRFGALGSGAGQLNNPTDIETDAAGNIYLIDHNNFRIEKFSGLGAFITQWGSSGTGNGQFTNPNSIAVDGSGNVYVTDYEANRVQKFSSTGAFLTKWGTTGVGDGQFNGLYGVAVNAGGEVLVVDIGNSRIQRFSSTGAFLGKWGSAGSGNGQFTAAEGIAIDPAGNVYVTDVAANRVQKFSASGTFITKWGSLGSGPGQFNVPLGIAADASGNIYVVDANNNRIQKFTGDGTFLTQTIADPSGSSAYFLAIDPTGNLYVPCPPSFVQKFVTTPQVVQIADVGNDQGRQVRLRIQRSSGDAVGSGATITGYAVYRRVDPLFAAAQASPGTTASGPAGIESIALAGWDYLGTQPAAGDAEYSMVVPTLADANTALNFSAFLVRALTPTPTTYYASGLENGYSVDNLSPAAPSPFTGSYAASATHLHWGASGAGDFVTFRLYRGSSADFTPGPGNLLITTTDTDYSDPGAAGRFYKLSAVDLNGNESAFASLGPNQTTDVTAPSHSLGFRLDPIRPNPAHAIALSIEFALTSDAPARLELLDVMGRVVATRDVGGLGAGSHRVSLAGDRRLSAGLYLVRLTQGTAARVTRVAVVN